MKNAVIWIMTVSTLAAGTGAHAQSLNPTPLRDSAQRAAIALARTPGVSQPATTQSAVKKCTKGALLGAAGGALFGFGSGFALLAASGGSDAAGAILKGFTVSGSIGGLLVGSVIGCK